MAMVRVEQDDKGWDARKRAYCLKIQPATGSFTKSYLFNKALMSDLYTILLPLNGLSTRVDLFICNKTTIST